MIKPFGLSVTYQSVEEALEAFVESETLEGDNQVTETSPLFVCWFY